jgi:hypothetical protein
VVVTVAYASRAFALLDVGNPWTGTSVSPCQPHVARPGTAWLAHYSRLGHVQRHLGNE